MVDLPEKERTKGGLKNIVGIYIVLSYVVKPSTYFPFVAYYSSLLML